MSENENDSEISDKEKEYLLIKQLIKTITRTGLFVIFCILLATLILVIVRCA